MLRAPIALPSALLLATGLSFGDDLTGADRLLCSAAQVAACTDDGECARGAPWELNVPHFIEVDLQKRLMSATKASGQNRVTEIKNLERSNGLIVAQGIENGRAFSFVIVEKTGMATVAVAADGRTVAVFGACTPAPAPR